MLMNVCSLLEMPVLTPQVSEPYTSTDFTLVLKVHILFYMLSAEDLPPHWFQVHERLSCISDPASLAGFDILVCAATCS
ncbi:unnamed protein product [Heterobilharzia americana]|nr:unnamed protein product [Heterobilharzia americana]